MHNLNDLYEVWHATNPTFVVDAAALRSFPKGYEHVANVTTPSVNDVFALTNTVYRPWWENPEVELTPEAAARGGARSTSVGDVIVKATAVAVNKDGSPRWDRRVVDFGTLRKF